MFAFCRCWLSSCECIEFVKPPLHCTLHKFDFSLSRFSALTTVNVECSLLPLPRPLLVPWGKKCHREHILRCHIMPSKLTTVKPNKCLTFKFQIVLFRCGSSKSVPTNFTVAHTLVARFVCLHFYLTHCYSIYPFTLSTLDTSNPLH